MKKYQTLGELLIDFRKHRELTQVDLAAILGVDVRTIIRWEKNESLIKTENEKILIENFGIPHQVIRNLNSDNPISVYFNFKRWIYSLTLLSSMVKNSKELKTDVEFKTSRIETLSDDKDFNFINYIQKIQKNCKPLGLEIIETSARILPDINLVIRDQSGYHGGHISILPLKYEAYIKIRDQKIKENQLTVNNLSRYMDEEPNVFYLYSMYSNSRDNTYYLINKLLFYFKKRKLQNYVFAGIIFEDSKVDRLREMGFKVTWEKFVDGCANQKATFLTGNFDEFLFNEKDF